MENFNKEELPRGTKIEKDGQTALDFDAVDNIEKEKIERKEIIKNYRIPQSQLDLLNKKGNEWFIGDENIHNWYKRMVDEEHEDDLSYIRSYHK